MLSSIPGQLQYRSEPQRRPAAPPEGTARAGRRDAHMLEREAPHAVDATLHDTSYALPNYTVFGRFRFVVDDLDDEERGFL